MSQIVRDSASWMLVLCGLWLRPLSGHAQQVRVDRDVAYAERARESLLADIYQPAGPGRFPGVLVIHGGAWFSGDKRYAAPKARRLAEAGYVAVSINYRLAPLARHPAQIEDCRAALTWMIRSADHYQIDVTRLGVMGYSAGGHLACLLSFSDWQQGVMAEQPTVRPVRAVVAGGAPCDFRQLPDDSQQLVYWLGGTRQQIPSVYRNASPLAFVSPDDPPTFLFHGERDRLVADDDAQMLADRLTQVGVRSQFHRVRGAGHLATYLDRETTELAVAFLDEVLKNTPPRACSPQQE